MNATASTKGKAKTIAGSVFEQLKNLGSSAVKSTVSEAGKIASGVPQNILKTQRGTEESMASDFAYNPERFIPKIEKPKRVKTPEMLLFSNQEREESLRINREVEMVLMEIKREIVILEKRQKTVIAEASRISMQALPEKVGIYHIRFFEWVLALLRDLHKKVSESATWLSHLNSKRRKKGYWGMFKKHGTSFGLSGERTVATQSG